MNYCKYCLEPSGSSEVCPKCQGEKAKVVPPHRLLPGTLLANRYRIGKVLGEGGFGITYVGRDTKLDMKVAVKEYYPNGLASRNNTVSSAVSCSASDDKQEVFLKFRDKFLQEARTLAMFSKEKSIVEVRDFFETNNTAYIIMEYLDGQDLREYQKVNGNMAVEKAIQVLTPVMHTLGKIHNQGLIHRDISPDNIRLTPEGVKLLDFGAAREMNTQINRSISVMLKPGYAPEEQYRSKGIQGPWTDVYAVCATIYKLITGVTPDDATQRVYSDELKKPSSYGIKISPAVEAVILKGMAVLQKDRYKSMDELMKALTNALQNRPTPPPAPPKPNNNSLDKTVAVSSLQSNKLKASQGATSTPNSSRQSVPKQNTSVQSVYTPPVVYPPVTHMTNITPPVTTVSQPKKKNYTPFIIIAIAALVTVAICIFIVFFSRSDSSGETKPSTTAPTVSQVAEPPQLSNEKAEAIVSGIYDSLLESDVKAINEYEALEWSYLEDGIEATLLEASGCSDISEAYSYISSYAGYSITNVDDFLAYWFSEPDDLRSQFEESFGNSLTMTCADFETKSLSTEDGTAYLQKTQDYIIENYAGILDPDAANFGSIEYYCEVTCTVTVSGTYAEEEIIQTTILGYVDSEWKVVYIEDDVSPTYLYSLVALSSLF